jgi:magnesium-transporting ATPase (P-type)
MKDFDHIISVWQDQPKKDQLSVDDMLKQVKKGVSGLSRKLFWNITIMAVTLSGILAVMLFFAFNAWQTYLGIAIILVAVLLSLLVMLRDYRIISKHDITINPAAYLQDLKEYQKNRSKLYGRLYFIYVLLMSAGLFLYFMEVLQSTSAMFKAISYSVYVAFVLFATFYIRGQFVKSEQEKLNLIIDRLTRLQNQFD